MIPLQDLIARFRTEDSFAAIELLCREPDTLAAAKAFTEAANHFYWKDKDLTSSVTFGRAGVQHALSSASRCDPGDTSLASGLRGQAKAMAYNLASFTWPGWDEPGIIIGPSDLAVGLDSAKANLRLAIALNKGPLPMSRAHWMLAAQELAAAKHDDAQRNFAKGCEHADAAGEEADRWLCAGFGTLSELLNGAPKSDETSLKLRKRLEEAKTRLQPLKDGQMFVQQIETALRVFGKGMPPIPS